MTGARAMFARSSRIDSHTGRRRSRIWPRCFVACQSSACTAAAQLTLQKEWPKKHYGMAGGTVNMLCHSAVACLSYAWHKLNCQSVHVSERGSLRGEPVATQFESSVQREHASPSIKAEPVAAEVQEIRSLVSPSIEPSHANTEFKGRACRLLH